MGSKRLAAADSYGENVERFRAVSGFNCSSLEARGCGLAVANALQGNSVRKHPASWRATMRTLVVGILTARGSGDGNV